MLRTHKWLILFCIVVAVGGALFLSSRQAPAYQSESDVLVAPIDVGVGSAAGGTAPNMVTEKSVASSLAVASEAANKLGPLVDPRDLLKHLSVEVPAGTEILTFKYSDESPKVAQQASRAFVESYLAFRREQAARQLTAVETPLQQQRDAIDAQLAKINRQLSHATRKSLITSLTQDANRLNTRRVIIEEQLAQLDPAAAADVGTILQPASLPSSSFNRSPVLVAILALLVGLMFGIGGAYLRDRLDDSIWTPEALEQASGTPSLGTIPSAARLTLSRKPHLINLPGTDDAFKEAYRSLRTGVLSSMEAGVKTIMITSVLPQEGKTTMSVNLATVLASAGKRVILASADMRRPRLAELLSVSEEPGLSEILVDHSPISGSVHLPGIKNLQVIPGGRSLTDPSEWLGSKDMVSVLRDLSQRADVVLLDATPLTGMADALALAPLVDGVILVCGAGLSTAEEVHTACRKLNQLNARLIGSVLNGFVAYRAGTRVPSDYYRTA